MLHSLRVAAVALAFSLVASAPAFADTCSIRIKFVKAGWVIGGTVGDGTLTCQGRSYPLSIGGLSYGFTFGVSSVNLRGTARNVRHPRDIEGRLRRGQRGCGSRARRAGGGAAAHGHRQKPDVPVVLIDTGYLFPETYRFADELTERLQLNLQVFRPLVSRAWMEARHGRLWEQGLVGIEQYNSLRKVEPMKRALKELGVGTWFTGLRRVQATSRANAPVLQQREDRWKINPIVDWTDRDVWQYMKQHDLPYHPLWEQGYVSIGDFHTTRRWEPGMREEDTRFNGLKRECGIHIDV